jgi:hypothetical protein
MIYREPITLQQLIESQLTISGKNKRFPNHILLIAEKGSVHYPVLKDFEFYLEPKLDGVLVFRSGKLIYEVPLTTEFDIFDLIDMLKTEEIFIAKAEADAEAQRWAAFTEDKKVGNMHQIIRELRPVFSSKWSKTHKLTRIYTTKKWKIVLGYDAMFAIVKLPSNEVVYEGKLGSSWFGRKLLENVGVL